MDTVRKNITLSSKTYETISRYAQKHGISFSEFLRDAAMETIARSENTGLLEYLNAHCSYVDNDEQKEIEALDINFANTSGKELTLDELLQG